MPCGVEVAHASRSLPTWALAGAPAPGGSRTKRVDDLFVTPPPGARAPARRATPAGSRSKTAPRRPAAELHGNMTRHHRSATVAPADGQRRLRAPLCLLARGRAGGAARARPRRARRSSDASCLNTGGATADWCARPRAPDGRALLDEQRNTRVKPDVRVARDQGVSSAKWGVAVGVLDEKRVVRWLMQCRETIVDRAPSPLHDADVRALNRFVVGVDQR